MTVTYEQAKRLKELGYDFDNRCICGGAMDCICEYLSDRSKRITISEALQWIRDNKEVACAVTLYLDNDGTFFYIGEYNIVDNRMFETAPFSTYPEAESQLLTELLTYLEKK